LTTRIYPLPLGQCTRFKGGVKLFTVDADVDEDDLVIWSEELVLIEKLFEETPPKELCIGHLVIGTSSIFKLLVDPDSTL